MNLSINLFVVTTLAIDDFRLLRRIRGLDIHSTFRTCAVSQFARIAEFHPFCMADVGMFGWVWQIMFFVEIYFLRNQSKWLF